MLSVNLHNFSKVKNLIMQVYEYFLKLKIM
ncbi:hypothetical protein SAMN05421876_11551 [Kaistella jeonii]|nr:hypothetical protein SAMN05421876_11551 [Kaistella jeonii]VEI95358.1 Uncharacterised protein [Kaistella jeonii]